MPDHSFPSGHVATATAVYGGIAVLAWGLAPTVGRWVWLLLLLPVFDLLARLYEAQVARGAASGTRVTERG